MKELRDEGLGYNHGHLVEEHGRWKAKIMAGTMYHQTGWPGEDVSAGGQGPLSDPSPGFITVCDAWESTMQKEAMWVTMADEIQVGLAYSSDFGGRSYKYDVCYMTTVHGTTHHTQRKRFAFRNGRGQNTTSRNKFKDGWMDGWIKLSWKSSPTSQEYHWQLITLSFIPSSSHPSANQSITHNTLIHSSILSSSHPLTNSLYLQPSIHPSCHLLFH